MHSPSLFSLLVLIAAVMFVPAASVYADDNGEDGGMAAAVATAVAASSVNNAVPQIDSQASSPIASAVSAGAGAGFGDSDFDDDSGATFPVVASGSIQLNKLSRPNFDNDDGFNGSPQSMSTFTNTGRPMVFGGGSVLPNRPIANPRLWNQDVSTGAAFAPGVQYALFNVRKGTCLDFSLPDHHHHHYSMVPMLKSVPCNNQQQFVRNSRMAFHMKLAEGNLMYLAAYDDQGREICAKLHHVHTSFYPCDSSSTKYSFTSTQMRGIRIRVADKDNKCINAVGHDDANVQPCLKSSRDQQFQMIMATAS